MSDIILANRYRIIRQIGTGGMALVYLATDERTHRQVAVKVLKPEYNSDAEFVSRFQREAAAASQLTHNNIVNLTDVGMDGNNRYLIMEYVAGQTLKEVIQNKGRLNYIVAVQITIRILAALQHAHDHGIIHRDIKPQNILVHADGHIKVADFGIARIVNSATLTRNDSVMGSVHYFSPEQASGNETTASSDIYSVGVTLYEMLTGRLPFEGQNAVSVAMQHLRANPIPIRQLAPDVPESICHVVAKAMIKNPQYRYQSARDMATELRLALEGRTDEMQPRLGNVTLSSNTYPPVSQSSGKQGEPSGSLRSLRRAPRRRMHVRWWLATVVVLAVVVYGIVVMSTSIYEKVINSALVDDYIDMDASSAQRSIVRNGLKAEIWECHHPLISAGTVMMQSPPEGVTLRKGDTVVLTVSKGPATQSMPRLEGMPLQDAITAANALGLHIMVVERVVSSTVQANYIITQVPEPGASFKSGDTVQVTVSGGVTYVPNIVGVSLTQARDALVASGMILNASLQYVETNNAALHNTVATQSPVADTAAMQGTSVSLSLYRVDSMMHRHRMLLDLPPSNSLTSVRVTLGDGSMEYTVFRGDFPANASRQPEIEIASLEAGTYTCKVYFNEKFAYQQQVTIP